MECAGPCASRPCSTAITPRPQGRESEETARHVSAALPVLLHGPSAAYLTHAPLFSPATSPATAPDQLLSGQTCRHIWGGWVNQQIRVRWRSGAWVAIWRSRRDLARKWQSSAQVAMWRRSGNLVPKCESGAQVAIWCPSGDMVEEPGAKGRRLEPVGTTLSVTATDSLTRECWDSLG